MTKGPPLRLIATFAVPMLIGGVFQLFYNLIDMLIVGKVNGSRELAAIGATASATFFLVSVTMGLTASFAIVMAQYFGAKKIKMVRTTLASAIYIAAACAVVLSLAGLFGARPLMRILRTPPEIIDLSVAYLRICIGGGVGLVAFNAASAILRAVGDSRTPLYFLILSSLLNVALDLVFVLTFGMGVVGVAVATVIAQVISAGLCVAFIVKRYPMFRLSRADFRPDWANVRMIAKLGISMGMQGFFLSIGDMTIAAVVNTFGTDVVAAYATGGRVQQFAMLLHFTITEAFAVFSGQNLGARRFERIREGFVKVAVVIVGLCFLSTIIIFLFGDSFVRLFIAANDPRVDTIVAIARSYLRVASCFYPFLGLILIYNNTLRGMGDALVPFLSGLTEITAKIGLSLGLGAWFGYHGVWFAMPVGWVLGIIPSCIRYHRGRWEKFADRIQASAESARINVESVRFHPKTL